MNDAVDPKDLPKPPPSTRRWIRYLIGFGVSVALGVAPFLGTVGVPGFTPVLSLFPESPWDTSAALIPIAALLMGTLAVLIQFWGRDNVGRQKLRRWFYRAASATLLSLLALFILHSLLVVSYPVPAENRDVSVLVGFARSASCQDCNASDSDVECLRKTTLAPSRIQSCWGGRQLQLAYLALAIPYLVLMACFGLIVGLLMLFEEATHTGRAATT